MNKRGLLVLVLSFVFMLSFVSAVSISTTNISSTARQIDIANAADIYSYEINFDYTGADATIAQNSFIGDGASATYGYKVKDGILSVYGSRLDSTAQGISGSNNLFNVSFTGNLVLRYVYLIQNDTAGIYVYYNNSVSDSGTVSDLRSSQGWAGDSGTTYVLEVDTMYKGIEKELGKGDSLKFSLNDGAGSYKIGIASFSDSNAVLFLSSAQNVTINYGESKKVDLNGDGLEDVILKVSASKNGVLLFITDNVPVEENVVDTPSGGVRDVSGGNVAVKTDVTYGNAYLNDVTVAVQGTIRGFFSGLWKSFVELFKF